MLKKLMLIKSACILKQNLLTTLLNMPAFLVYKWTCSRFSIVEPAILYSMFTLKYSQLNGLVYI